MQEAKKEEEELPKEVIAGDTTQVKLADELPLSAAATILTGFFALLTLVICFILILKIQRGKEEGWEDVSILLSIAAFLGAISFISSKIFQKKYPGYSIMPWFLTGVPKEGMVAAPVKPRIKVKREDKKESPLSNFLLGLTFSIGSWGILLIDAKPHKFLWLAAILCSLSSLASLSEISKEENGAWAVPILKFIKVSFKVIFWIGVAIFGIWCLIAAGSWLGSIPVWAAVIIVLLIVIAFKRV